MMIVVVVVVVGDGPGPRWWVERGALVPERKVPNDEYV